jgi:two-component system phosphate regulon sensor histidine kinase PhoR
MRTTAEGSEAVSVAVVLLDPDALYMHQRQRLMWFGALIGVSGLVAVIGLVSTWAGIRRQERLYEMQGNFVSSVTHELRAPIGANRLMAENFQGGKVSEPVEQKRFFGYMVQECRRLSSMIENVLSLARMEQGRSVHEFEPTDVTRLVEDTAQLLQGSANERGVTLQLDINRAGLSALPCAAVLDGRAVQQALINLIDNALKHSRAGSTVTLGAALAGTIPSRLRLWVADQGTGIPKEDQERVFERFYRRGSELRRETVGIGIGLSLVKHTAEAHGGVVTIESDVGRGSCFTLELPLTAPGTGSPGLPS